MPTANWMDTQLNITWTMRERLVEFLIQVHKACHLRPATLFLAVNILDRYCCRRMINRQIYKLAACTSLLVATKFRERKERVPSLRRLGDLCESLYTVTDFIDQEWDLLEALQWAVDHPDACTCVELSLAGKLNPVQKHVSMYITEISLFYQDTVYTRPSILSVSAQVLAEYVIRCRRPSSPSIEHFDVGTIDRLYSHLLTPPVVLFTKYASPKFSEASRIVERFMACTEHVV